MTSLINCFRRLTLLEWLIVLAIVAIGIALLVPGVPWGASGLLTIPIRVRVYDMESGRLIPDADVAIVISPWEHSPESEFTEDVRSMIRQMNCSPRSQTGKDGVATVEYTFITDSNYKKPAWDAIIGSRTAIVRASGYGGAASPLTPGVSLTPAAKLREQKEIRIPIGLLRVDSTLVPPPSNRPD